MRAVNNIFSLLCFLILWVLPERSNAQQKEVPASLQPFVIKGYEVLDFLQTDLNADQKTDGILLLKIKHEDTINTEDVVRPLLLLIKQPDGKLKIAVKKRQRCDVLPLWWCIR